MIARSRHIRDGRGCLDAERDYMRLYRAVRAHALTLCERDNTPRFPRDGFGDLYQEAGVGVERAKHNQGGELAVDNKIAYLSVAVLRAHQQQHRRQQAGSIRAVGDGSPPAVEVYPLDELDDGDPALLVEEPAFADDDFSLQQLGAMKAVLRELSPPARRLRPALYRGLQRARACAHRP
jgi:hypothetical protein